MVTDELVRSIALFFLFSLMDEKAAMQAAQRAVAQLKAQGASAAPRAAAASGNPIGDSPAAPAYSAGDVIRVLRKLVTSAQKQLPRNRPTVMPQASWVLPAGFDIAAWAKFQKDAPEQEVVAVVLAKVLRYSEEEIAQGLNISLGTARYRIGKGIRQLGQTVNAKRVPKAGER